MEDNTFLPDETIKAIESGKSVHVAAALFRDRETGWHAMALEEQYWEHLASKLVGEAEKCPTCKTLVECFIHSWKLEWRQEPEGWILRFPTTPTR